MANFHLWLVLKRLEGGELNFRALSRGFNPQTVGRWAGRAAKWGLVEVREEDGWPYRRWYRLTALGRRLLGEYHRLGEIVGKIRAAGRSGRWRASSTG